MPGAGVEPATSGHLFILGDCSPDHESGAITRLGYPGFFFFANLKDNNELRVSGFCIFFTTPRFSQDSIEYLIINFPFTIRTNRLDPLEDIV